MDETIKTDIGAEVAEHADESIGAESAAVKRPAKKAKQKPTDEKTEKKPYKVRKNLDPNMIVTVRNGYQGTLVYISKKTGEKFIFDDFGDEQDIELSELKNAKNSSKKFFLYNWFLFDDPEIIEYLGVESFYKNALTYDGFDEIFTLPPQTIKERLALLSIGQQKSVAYRARRLIADGKIDSIKVITALEKGLGIDLIER